MGRPSTPCILCLAILAMAALGAIGLIVTSMNERPNDATFNYRK